MNRKLYFAYGLNLNHEHMARSVPTALPVGPRKIEGYRLVMRAFADIVKSDPEDYIWGGCWLIDERAEECLDVIEGYPYLYKKITIDDMLTYQMTDYEIETQEVIDFSDCEGENEGLYVYAIKQGLADFGLSYETWMNNLRGHKNEV